MRKAVFSLGILGLALAAGTSLSNAQQGGGPPAPPLSLKIAGFSDGGDVPSNLDATWRKARR